MKDFHLVPSIYHDLVNQDCNLATRYKKRPDTENWIKGGQRIDDEWTNKFVEEIRKNFGTPTCYVLSIGSNNVRNHPHINEHNKTVRLVHKICKAIKLTQLATICVVSPIPDGNGRSIARIEKLNKDLSKVCRIRGQAVLKFDQENWGLTKDSFEDCDKVKFVPFTDNNLFDRFREKTEGSIQYNQRYFKSDRIHLNEKGARLLAEMILKAQSEFSHEVYGCSIPKRVEPYRPRETVDDFEARLDQILKQKRKEVTKAQSLQNLNLLH